MTEPLSDVVKVRLVGSVVVQDDAGQSRTFGPADEVPAWARKKITNPSAWGYLSKRKRGPVTDYGRQVLADGLLDFMDVVCSATHARRIIARFEPVMLLDGPAEPIRWEWHWTTARVPGGVEALAAGSPAPERASIWDGQRWSFRDVATDRGPRHAVVHGPAGKGQRFHPDQVAIDWRC